VALVEEGRPVLLKTPDAAETRLPQGITFARGDVTPYRITLTRNPGGTTAAIEGAADGTIKVLEDGHASS